jgi:hypothetical protein
MSSDTSYHIILLTNVCATWYCVGLIWFVQMVAYPQFARVGAETFARYHAAHMRWTSWVVAPVMLIELITTAALVSMMPDIATWAGTILLGIVWINTFAVEVPTHHQLRIGGFNTTLIRTLVRHNWLRTFAWTARGGVAIWLLMNAMNRTS